MFCVLVLHEPSENYAQVESVFYTQYYSSKEVLETLSPTIKIHKFGTTNQFKRD